MAKPLNSEAFSVAVPLIPEHREFILEKPQRPSTVEDAKAAVAEITAMLAHTMTAPKTTLAKRRAELRRQAEKICLDLERDLQVAKAQP